MRTFDTVVVGAGAAGCVIATRLASRRDRTVLLVEAGADDPELEALLDTPRRLPASAGWRLSGTIIGSGASVPIPRVRAVGGTSLLQGGVALRPPPMDFDRWASEVDDASWSHSGMLPYLCRLEHDQDVQSDQHGVAGPVAIRRAGTAEIQPLHRAFLEACAELGLPWCADLNTQTSSGFGMLPLARRGTRKQTARSCYLANVRTSGSVTLLSDVRVLSVRLDRQRACGVDVVDRVGAVRRIACGQVILAAGSVGSPVLLLRSGVGDPERLRAAGVAVRHELPGVGTRLRDHPAVWTTFGLQRGCGGPDPLWFQVMARQLDVRASDNGDFAVEAFHDFRLLPGDVAYRRGAIVTSLLSPRRAGHVRLGSRGDAVVELGYHEPADLVSLAAAFDFTQRVLGTGSMRALGPYHRRLLGIAGHGGSVPAGVPGFFPLDGTTEWERPTEVLRHATVTAHHLHGGCPMGGSADSDAVVDTRCRVHGIESLYVADVSIAPVPVRANTHLLALCVGERASDLVRG